MDIRIRPAVSNTIRAAQAAHPGLDEVQLARVTGRRAVEVRNALKRQPARRVKSVAPQVTL